MQIAILLLCIGAALFVVLSRWYAQQTRLRRLSELIALPHVWSAPMEGAQVGSLERFLPRAVARDLRLLEINPTARGAAAMLAVAAIVMVSMSLLAGWLSAIAAMAALAAAAIAALNILAHRRINELGALLPGFFDRVRQLLVIGNSLPTAFARAVQGGQPRLVVFFAPALRRIANGAGIADSIRQSADDVSLYEMQLFAVAVSTNMRFGGSLTHSLNNLVVFLRKRASIERELRASTSLIRSSAWVLGLLPVLVAALIVTQNRDYAHWFVADPTGKLLLAYCVASQISGALVMRSIIRTEF